MDTAVDVMENAVDDTYVPENDEEEDQPAACTPKIVMAQQHRIDIRRVTGSGDIPRLLMSGRSLSDE